MTSERPARDPDEASLLMAARGGDPLAFERLIRPHLPVVRRLAYAFSRDSSEADDLAQEACIRAFRAVSGFEGRSAFSTWLYLVVRSTFLDARRGRRRPERGAEDTLDVQETSLERQDAVYEHKEAADRLWTALRSVDETMRVPLVLFAVEGMSYEEIAEIERIPIGTVRSRIARARAQLAELLAAGEKRATSTTNPETRTTETSSNPSRRSPA